MATAAAPGAGPEAGKAQQQPPAQQDAELHARMARLEDELAESRRAATAAQEQADFAAAEAVLLRLQLGQLESVPGEAAQQAQRAQQDRAAWEAEREQLQQLTAAAVAEAARLTSQLAEAEELRQQMAAVLPVLQMQVETAVQLCVDASRKSEREADAARERADAALQKASWSFRLAAQFWQRLSQLQPELAGLLDPSLVGLLRGTAAEATSGGGAADAPPMQPAWEDGPPGTAAEAAAAAALADTPAPAAHAAVPTPEACPPVQHAAPPAQADLQAQLLAAVLGALPATAQAQASASAAAATSPLQQGQQGAPPAAPAGPASAGGAPGQPGPGQVMDVRLLHKG